MGVLTYLHNRILAYLHTCILAYFHTCIPTYLHTCILAYLHTFILEYLNTWILAYLHTSQQYFTVPKLFGGFTFTFTFTLTLTFTSGVPRTSFRSLKIMFGFWYFGKVKKFQINRYIRLKAFTINSRGGFESPPPSEVGLNKGLI